MHLTAIPTAILLAAVAWPAYAQARTNRAADTQESESYDGAIVTARALVSRLMSETSVPGLSVAVAVHDRIAWSEGFGMADVELRTPVTTLTRFRIGSVSKPLTSAAMLTLVKSGRLNLDAPITRYVPQFPDKGQPITARQLAGHLGGIRHYRDGETINYRQYGDVVAALDIFAGDSLVQPPGTRYTYSSFGYNLLSAAIQSAAGEPFLAYVRRAVLDPLGMRYTTADHVDSIVSQRASFYRYDGGLLNARFTNDSYKWASGGYLSTAEDLARFGMGLLTGALFTAPELDALFTSQRTRDGKETGYGMGWRPREDWHGRGVVHHGGSSEGGRAFLLLYPRERVVVALLANMNPAPIFEQEAQTIAHFFMEHPRDTLTAAVRHERAGQFQFSTMVGRDSVSGVLALTTSSRKPGWMSWSNGPSLGFVTIDTLHQGETRVTGVGVQGVVNLWLSLENGRLGGRWDWLGRTVPIRGVRSTR